MDAIVEMRGLRKVYHRMRRDDVVAVENLDLALGRPGTVHGFLGPNGSGKTTTIRCALNLIRPTAGSTSIFGVESSSGFHKVAHRVGAIVESPKMFPNFSGRRNLRLLADLGGIKRSNVERVLEIVGLADRGNDNFGTYSLGMRQRLAIAGALLKDPDLLILDEPANGLDPAGIAEMRVLIRGIAEQGKAVVVSSHQLAEIEQICDDVTIISRGKLVQTGRLADIRSFAGQDKVVATIAHRDDAIMVLQASGIPAHPRPQPDELLVDIEPARSAEVTRALAVHGRYLSGLRLEHATLEQAFLNLTGDAPPPPMAPAGYGAPAAAPPGPPAAPAGYDSPAAPAPTAPGGHGSPVQPAPAPPGYGAPAEAAPVPPAYDGAIPAPASAPPAAAPVNPAASPAPGAFAPPSMPSSAVPPSVLAAPAVQPPAPPGAYPPPERTAPPPPPSSPIPSNTPGEEAR